MSVRDTFIVTSYKWGDPAGDEFQASFAEWNARGYSLLTFVDGAVTDGILPPCFLRLENYQAWNRWVGRASHNRAACRRGHQAFAIKLAKDILKSGLIIWIDADVKFHDEIDFDWIDQTKALTYIGSRDPIDTSLLAMDFEHNRMHEIVDGVISSYTGLSTSTLSEGYFDETFSRWVRQAELPEFRMDQWVDMEWRTSPLGKFSTHGVKSSEPRREKAI